MNVKNYLRAMFTMVVIVMMVFASSAQTTKKVGYFTKAGKGMHETATPANEDPIIKMLQDDDNFEVFVNEVAQDSVVDLAQYDVVIAQETFGSTAPILSPTGSLGMAAMPVPFILNKSFTLRGGRGFAADTPGSGSQTETEGWVYIKVDPANQSNDLFKGITFVGDSVALFKYTTDDSGNINGSTNRALNYAKEVVITGENTLLAVPAKVNDGHVATVCINDIPAGQTIGSEVLTSRMMHLGYNFGAMCASQGTNMTSAGLTIWRNAIYSLAGLTVPDVPVAVKKHIFFVADTDLDDEHINWLREQGFAVTVDTLIDASNDNNVSMWSTDELNRLSNTTDLVIVGRGTTSGRFTSPNKEVWNSLRIPLLCASPWDVRNSKLNWFNSGKVYQDKDQVAVLNATVLEPTDAVFSGVTLADGKLDWMNAPHDMILDKSGESNASILANYGDTIPLLARFAPWIEFYPKAGDAPLGNRTYMGFGNDQLKDADGNKMFEFFTLTENGKKVYLEEINRLIEAGTTPEASMVTFRVNLNDVADLAGDSTVWVTESVNGKHEMSESITPGVYTFSQYIENGTDITYHFSYQNGADAANVAVETVPEPCGVAGERVLSVDNVEIELPVVVFGSCEESVRVYFIADTDLDDEHINFLRESGFVVTVNTAIDESNDNNLSTFSAEELAVVEGHDLIVIGRGTTSGRFTSPNKEIWNSLRTPIICASPWDVRNSKLNWFNSGKVYQDKDQVAVVNATILESSDEVFSGVTLTDGKLDWMNAPHDMILDVSGASNATVLAHFGDTIPLFARFAPMVEFYPEAGDMPLGYRTYFGFGNDQLKDENGDKIFKFFTLTENGKNVYLAEINRLIALSAPAIANEAYLANITSEGSELEPSFNQDSMTYTLYTEAGVATVDVKGVAKDYKATVSGDGEIAVPGTATIIVTAEDGTTTKSYTVNTEEAVPVVTFQVDIRNISDLYEGGAVSLVLGADVATYEMTYADGVYKYSYDVAQATELKYNFTYQNGANATDIVKESAPSECGDAEGYRLFTVPANDTVLAAILFGTCAPMPDITDLAGTEVLGQWDGLPWGGPGTGSPEAEGSANLIDNDVNTKYLSGIPVGWVQIATNKYSTVSSYTISSANDAPDRDLRSWEFQAYEMATDSWVTLHSVTDNDPWPSFFTPKSWAFENTKEYYKYRLNISAVNGGDLVQFSEIEIFGVIGDTFVEPKHVYFFADGNNDDEHIQFLQDNKFRVTVDTVTWESLSTASKGRLDSINDADIVIVGRGPGSSKFDKQDKPYWNGIKAPLVMVNPYGPRAKRTNWFNSDEAEHHADSPETIYATVKMKDDGIFSDVTLVGDSLDWMLKPNDVLLHTAGTETNAEIVATWGNDYVLVARFEPQVEFYPGSVDKASGYRTYFGFGYVDGDANNYMPLTDNAQTVYVAELNRMVDLPEAPMSDDATLAGITSDVGTISPEFSSDVRSYTIEVPKGTTSVEIAATATDVNATVLGTGTFSVPGSTNIVVTSDDGSASIWYTVSITEGVPVSVSELGNNVVEFYPNPASHSIYLKGNVIADVQIYSTLGKLVVDEENVSSVNVQELSPGSYIVKVVANRTVTVGRLIVK